MPELILSDQLIDSPDYNDRMIFCGPTYYSQQSFRPTDQRTIFPSEKWQYYQLLDGSPYEGPPYYLCRGNLWTTCKPTTNMYHELLNRRQKVADKIYMLCCDMTFPSLTSHLGFLSKSHQYLLMEEDLISNWEIASWLQGRGKWHKVCSADGCVRFRIHLKFSRRLPG